MGSTRLAQGSAEFALTPGRYRCALLLLEKVSVVKGECAEFDVPPTAPPGPVEIVGPRADALARPVPSTDAVDYRPAMNRPMFVALAAALILVGSTCLWLLLRAPDPSPANMQPSPPPSAADIADTTPGAPIDAPNETPPPAITARRADTFGGLEVLVTTSDGQAVEGARLFAAHPPFDPWTLRARDDAFVALDAAPTDAAGRTRTARGAAELWCLGASVCGRADVSADADSVTIVVARTRAAQVRVVDTAGNPVADRVVAAVAVFSGRALPLARARTDGDGVATFADLQARIAYLEALRMPESPLAFVIEAVGVLAHERAQHRFEPGELADSDPTLVEPPLGNLRTSASHWPTELDLAEAKVAVRDGAGLVLDAIRDPGSDATWSVLACAETAFVAALDAPHAAGRIEAQTPPGWAPTVVYPLELMGERVRLSGRVVEPALGAMGVSIRVAGKNIGFAPCDADGGFALGVPRSEVPADVELALYVPDARPARAPRAAATAPHTVAAPLDGDLDVGELRFVVEGIRGRVADEQGTGIAGATVLVERAQENADDLDGDGSLLDWHPYRRVATTTDTDGSFALDQSLRGLDGETFRLRASAEGRAPSVTAPLTRPPAIEVALVLMPSGTLRGIVTAATREVLEDARVSFLGPEGLGTVAPREAVRGQEGAFELPFEARDLALGRHRAFVSVRVPTLMTRVAIGSVDVEPGNAAPPLRIDLDSRLRLVTCQIAATDGTPIDARIYGRGADGAPREHFAYNGALRLALHEWAPGEALVRAPGYQLGRLAPGRAETLRLERQAPTRFTLAPGLAAQTAGAEGIWVAPSWLPPEGFEPVPQGSGQLQGDAVGMQLSPGRYRCELLVRTNGAIAKLACAEFEVPSRAPPGPVEIGLRPAQ